MNTKRTLIASAAPAEQTLSNIQVSGIRKQTNINYTVPTSRAATGMDLTLRETPQSLSVMIEKQISDQGIESLQDALNQMAGVYHSKMGNNATGAANLPRAAYRLTHSTSTARKSFTTPAKPFAAAPII